MASGDEHNTKRASLRARLAAEIAELTRGLTFPARRHVHVEGKLVNLKIHPRWHPRVPGEPKRPECLDVVLLIEPHALLADADEAEIEGMRDGYQELAAAEEPNIHAVGVAGLADLEEQLRRPRLSHADLMSPALVLMRQGRPFPTVKLPPARPDENGRALFRDVPVDASSWLEVLDERGRLRQAAAEAAGRRPSRAARPATTAPQARMRIAPAYVPGAEAKIEYAGGGADAPSLAQDLSSNDPQRRRRAAETLGERGPDAVSRSLLAPLASLLEDPEWAVRWAAARALGRMGDKAATKEVLSRLAQLLYASDRDVLYATQEALVGIGQAAWTDEIASRLDEIASRLAEMLRADYRLVWRICYDLPDRRITAELQRKADGTARLVVYSSESSLAGATVAYRLASEKGRLTLDRRSPEKWCAEADLQQEYALAAPHLPEFQVLTP
jgi:hypothetical protein